MSPPRIIRTRHADGCAARAKFIGRPCGRCDRAEATAPVLEARDAIDPTSDVAFLRSQAASVLAYVGRERRWDLAHSDIETRNPLGDWARSMIARAAWYRAAAQRVAVLP